MAKGEPGLGGFTAPIEKGGKHPKRREEIHAGGKTRGSYLKSSGGRMKGGRGR